MLKVSVSPKHIDKVQAFLSAQPAIKDSVQLLSLDESKPQSTQASFQVSMTHISFPLDWQTESLPYLLPSPLPWDEPLLKGLILGQLGHLESAQRHLNKYPDIYSHIHIIYQIKNGYTIQLEDFTDTLLYSSSVVDRYRAHHNTAVVFYYGHVDGGTEIKEVTAHFQQAFRHQASADLHAFTAFHLAKVLIEQKAYTEAHNLLQSHLPSVYSAAAQEAFQTLLQKLSNKK